MTFKFCPECGFKLDKPYKFCPECGFKLGDGNAISPVLDAPASPQTPLFVSQQTFAQDFGTKSEQEVFLDKFELQQIKQDEYNKTLLKAKVYSKREQFANADKIYEELLAKDSRDVNAFIGFVRTSSKNFSVLNSNEVDQNLKKLFDLANVNSLFEEEEEFNDFLAKKGLLESWQLKIGHEKCQIQKLLDKQREEVYKKLFGDDEVGEMFSANAIKRFEREKAVDQYILQHGKSPQDFMREMAEEKENQLAKQKQTQLAKQYADAKNHLQHGEFDKAQDIYNAILSQDENNLVAKVGTLCTLSKNFSYFDNQVGVFYDELVKKFGKDKILSTAKNATVIEKLRQDFVDKQKQAEQQKQREQEEMRFKESQREADDEFDVDGELEVKVSIGYRGPKTSVFFGMWPQSKKDPKVKIVGEMDKPNTYFGDDNKLYAKVGKDYFRFEKLQWDFTDGGFLCRSVIDLLPFDLNNGTKYSGSTLQKFLTDEFVKMAFPYKPPVLKVVVQGVEGLAFVPQEIANLSEIDFFSKNNLSDYFKAKVKQVGGDNIAQHYFWTLKNSPNGFSKCVAGMVSVSDPISTREQFLQPKGYAGVVPMVCFDQEEFDTAYRRAIENLQEG